jgi:hypothetical protein
MSSTLFFSKTPVQSVDEIAAFKQPLKGIIAARYYDHDGSLSGDTITLTAEDLPFLEGVLAAYRGDDCKDLVRVVDHLKVHGMIDVRIDH